MFESTDKELYFTAQWFFRAEDTVASLIHQRDNKIYMQIVCHLQYFLMFVGDKTQRSSY